MTIERSRARALGIRIGDLATGLHNAITDVQGVEVGHRTVAHGSADDPVGSGPSRTGITAIWPHRDDIFGNPVSAGFFALSGTGEMTGRSEIEELGRIATPILLTNTMNVGVGYEGVCRYLMGRDPEIGADAGVVIPVVAECDDSHLHDARGSHVTVAHVAEALDAASSGPVAEGAVGAGTGMHAFRFKGGIGSSSRVLAANRGGWTVGVLTMVNFGARHRLTIDGVPVGRHFPITPLEPSSDEGSGIVIVATDAPLDARQLSRVARRASLGLGRTGSIGANGSGELIVAFSTTHRPAEEEVTSTQPVVDGHWIDFVFEATIDAVEESVVNAICMAQTTDGRLGRVLEGIPLDELQAIMRRYGRLED
jgi:D-aminopeptidase